MFCSNLNAFASVAGSNCNTQNVAAMARQNHGFPTQFSYGGNISSVNPPPSYSSQNSAICGSYRSTQDNGNDGSELMSPTSSYILFSPGSDSDYGIHFPLTDDEVSSYNFEVPTSSNMQWNANVSSYLIV